MTLPTIHLNGTSKAVLIESQCVAGAAIQDAIRALQNASPNGRDYYPQGPNALRKAEAEHGSRIERLTAVYREIHQLIEAIDEL